MTTDSDLSIANIICSGILLIVLVLPAFLLSRLLKIEHDDFHEQWEKDGRPHGMPFWFPMGELHLLGFRSYPWFVGYSWLFKTPEWVKEHKVAKKVLKYYRFVSYTFYLGSFAVCLLLLFLAPR